jgi:hypothetical protein
MRWLADQVLKAFNFVPELFLEKGSPHFDVLRWWLLLMVVVVLVILAALIRRAFRHDEET